MNRKVTFQALSSLLFSLMVSAVGCSSSSGELVEADRAALSSAQALLTEQAESLAWELSSELEERGEWMFSFEELVSSIDARSDVASSAALLTRLTEIYVHGQDFEPQLDPVASVLRAEYSRFFANASDFAVRSERDALLGALGQESESLGEDFDQVVTCLFGARLADEAERAGIYEDLARKLGLESRAELGVLEAFGNELLAR